MDVLEAILTRASVRRFKPDPIPEDVVRRVLEAGVRAPTAGGGQQWFFIVIKNPQVRRKLRELLVKAHIRYAEDVVRNGLPEDVRERWFKSMFEGGEYDAPLYIAAYVDLRRRLYRDEYSALERLWAVQSLAAAIENMILAAWGEGIGSVWLGVPLLMREEFDRLLRPPEGCELQAIIALGYPKRLPMPRPRRPLSNVVKLI